MSARNRRPTIEHLAKLAAAVGLATCIATFAPASAWGGCGGGGGGGHSVAPSGAPQQNDPQKMKQLKDLTKRLKSELHLDNQKSKAVQAKELDQIKAIQDILDASPDTTDPAWIAADQLAREATNIVANAPMKY
jgi:hypothetical protein